MRLHSACLVGALLLVVLQAFVWIGWMAMQMDSASAYHPIACLEFPLSYFNVMDLSACGKTLDLNVHGWFTWPRASAYQGFFPSIFYYPLWMLWDSPNSIFLMNSIYMLIGITMLSLFARIDWRIAAIVFGGNAYVQYMMLHDYGFLATMPLVAFAVPLLLTKALETQHTGKAIAMGIAAGVLAFTIFETKSIFIYLFPCIVLVTGVVLAQKDLKILRNSWRWLPGGILALALAALLLTSYTQSGTFYGKSLIGYKKADMDPSPYFIRFWHIIDAYWLRFPNSAAPTYSASPDGAMRRWRDGYDLLVTLPFWIVAAWLFWQNRKADRHYRRLALALAAAGFLHSLELAAVHNAYHGNHMAPAIFYMAAAAAVAAQGAYSLRPKATALMLVLLVISQLECAIYMAKHPVDSRAAPEIVQMVDYLDRSDIGKRYFTLHMNWGAYYFDSLYGPREQVVMTAYSWKPDEANFNTLKKTAAKFNRKLAFVILKSTRLGYGEQSELLRQRLAGMIQVYPETGNDSLWEVWVEPLDDEQPSIRDK